MLSNPLTESVDHTESVFSDAVGSGLKINGISSVTLCVQISETKLAHVATNFPIYKNKDVATVSSDGTYSLVRMRILRAGWDG